MLGIVEHEAGAVEALGILEIEAVAAMRAVEQLHLHLESSGPGYGAGIQTLAHIRRSAPGNYFIANPGGDQPCRHNNILIVSKFPCIGQSSDGHSDKSVFRWQIRSWDVNRQPGEQHGISCQG